MFPFSKTEFEKRFRETLSKIPAHVTLVAVSKVQPVEAIEAAYHLGQRDFGENYVQELVGKAEELDRRGCVEIRWHFIGHLQTNKVKALIPWVSCIQSVDSLKLAKEVSKRWKASGRVGKIAVFLQVNQDSESSKSGLAEGDVVSVAQEIAVLEGVELLGLMSIPDPSGDSTSAFRRLRELEKSARPATRGMLSMGMSSDFESAIQEGATHVRVGTSLFGERS
jgi:pyridoxal phosphate enzyme (YggS family)